MPATLITGANRGLGLEFSRQYLADEWQVIAACRDPKTALELLALPDPAQKLRVITMDVTDLDSVRAAAEEVRGIAIDVLLNNAGVGGRWDQTVGNMDYVEWSKVIDVNTMGPLRVLEAFLDHVVASERKLVVTLTSGMGSIADNGSGGSIAYRSSKAAVNMVTRSAAIDLADRAVTCVVVNPGWVRTDMGGSEAPLTPQESITRLRKLFEKLSPAESGKFFNHDGREYPW
jgi:NAD(P)-dependent dehydrogenase (short-subunit alcohol dehydrogenase family)